VRTLTMSVNSTPGSTQASGVLSLLTATSNTSEDIKFLQGYIESLDMLKILDEKIHLKKLYNEQYIDLFFSLSSSSSIESYLKYYQSRVKVHVDDKTG
ncbi:capsule biosynthesis protein, partial [Campylobacter jejuni]|nr:capsule biosynthesis protein [Campylobacter jejuni]